jgi:tRNA(fMet)-specific endonuclease VapC
MGRVVVDSDVLIDFLRRKPGAKAVLASISRDDLPCCSVITVAEVRAGMRPEEEPITSFLFDVLEVLPVDRETAVLAGQLKQSVMPREVELDDCLIAATAIRNNAPLLTHNPKHYPHAELALIPARY